MPRGTIDPPDDVHGLCLATLRTQRFGKNPSYGRLAHQGNQDAQLQEKCFCVFCTIEYLWPERYLGLKTN